MTHERAVDGRKAKSFDLALRKQKTIKRISRFRLGIGSRYNMPRLNLQQVEPGLRDGADHVFQRHPRIELAQSCLDRDFP